MTRSTPTVEEILAHGELVELGSVPGASNDTRLVLVEHAGEVRKAIHKPAAGEAPLSDFPDGTLASREVAAYRLSAWLGLDVVPPTVMRFPGSPRRGSLQAFVDADVAETGLGAGDRPAPSPVPEAGPGSGSDADAAPVDLLDALESAVPSGLFAKQEVPGGFVPILDGLDEEGHEIVYAHGLTAPLRRVAFFDLLANNADRKDSHLVHGSFDPSSDESRLYGIDHGLTFHATFKLRTVLWGFAGREWTEGEVRDLHRVVEGAAELEALLGDLLEPAELAALGVRAELLARAAGFPYPPDHRMAVPWPPV